MARSRESFLKKEVKSKKDKKRKAKEEKRLAKKDSDKKGSLDDMIAYVDENGNITSTPPDLSKKRKVKLEDIEIGVPKSEGSGTSSRHREGVVTFFNHQKGYGFIRDSESGEKVFVHISNVDGDLYEGDQVSFVISGFKSPAATQVKVINN